MSNSLKIYDFHLKHKQHNTAVTYFQLALDHSDINRHITAGANAATTRRLAFEGFCTKLSEDLSSERISDSKKIIKHSRIYSEGTSTQRNFTKVYANKVVYGLLHGGKVSKNSTLEVVREDENEYNNLGGNRIYDDFFFMLHLSYTSNKARLFIISSKDTTKTDTLFKKYLLNELFSAPHFNKTKWADFISETYRDQVLRRSIVRNIHISKSTTIVEEEGNEYYVEIILRPANNSAWNQITQPLVSKLRRSRVSLLDSATDDENSEVRFSIKDTQTNKSKVITFGNEESFFPKIEVSDAELLGLDGNIDLVLAKAICEEYISFEDDPLTDE